MTWWWSYLLAAIGVFGLYLTTRKLWHGFAVGVLVQLLWITYAIATQQYGFIASALAYGAVNTLGLIRWTRDKPEPPLPRRHRTLRDPGPEMPGPWD